MGSTGWAQLMQQQQQQQTTSCRLKTAATARLL